MIDSVRVSVSYPQVMCFREEVKDKVIEKKSSHLNGEDLRYAYAVASRLYGSVIAHLSAGGSIISVSVIEDGEEKKFSPVMSEDEMKDVVERVCGDVVSLPTI